MFTLGSNQQFHLYAKPADMRKSFAGLSGLVRNDLGGDPQNGSVFIFINKKRDKIKLLQWQHSGFVLYYKCLEEGTFELPAYKLCSGAIELSYPQLIMLIDGLSIKNIVQRKRYQSTPNIG